MLVQNIPLNPLVQFPCSLNDFIGVHVQPLDLHCCLLELCPLDLNLVQFWSRLELLYLLYCDRCNILCQVHMER